MKHNTPPNHAAQTCTIKERKQASHETAAPASAIETANTITNESEATPGSVSSSRAPNDPEAEPQ